jgi:hypothetical protein
MNFECRESKYTKMLGEKMERDNIYIISDNNKLDFKNN